jgi:hypothetical protein
MPKFINISVESRNGSSIAKVRLPDTVRTQLDALAVG